MTTLARMEELFWRSVRFDPPPADVDLAFASTAKLTGRERIALYRRGYWFRHVDALFDTYPVLARVLGTERFTKLVCRYVTAHPSIEPALERLGQRLSEFMLEQGEDATFADIACLEWAQTCALLAPDPARTLTIAALDLDAFPQTRLRLVPSVVVCRVRLAAFAAVHGAEADEGAASSDSVAVLVHRPGHAVEERLLAADEAHALDRVREGRVLSEVVTAFAASPDPVKRAALCLMRWLRDGLVAETISISSEPEGTTP